MDRTTSVAGAAGVGALSLTGVGLHSGAESEVRLELEPGPTRLVQSGERVLLSSLSVARTDQGVCVTGGRELRIDLVEHLFAAMAALHADTGVSVSVDGPELPLLDGACRRWFDALLAIGVAPGRPSQRIVRARTYERGDSRYEFEPFDGSWLEVWVDYGPGLGAQHAIYRGDVEQFREDIAVARTFGFRRDARKLRRNGRAAAVDPSTVLVFDDCGALVFPADPPAPDELARHKLLDLCGDLFLHGGLPIGRLRVRRPGHGATHAVMQRARADGVVSPL